jgi:hypothetical protein
MNELKNELYDFLLGVDEVFECKLSKYEMYYNKILGVNL